MNSLRTKSTTTAIRICSRHASSSTKAAAAAAAPSKATASSEPSWTKKRESLDPAQNRDKFLVGNPHPVSNLRPVLYPIPANESKEDRLFRERRERVDAFNQNFWVNNNAMFNKAKAEFEEKVRAMNGNQPVTTDELSVFYKDFLDKAYERQLNYNKQWWIENIGLLLPAAKAAVRKWTSRSS
ncbi:hypothetical protein BG015_005707 [Linnemannia schmuckeri]|uniref:Uncharacterized protein n=1 Tax=Linnemannia schmuckeri TaxID=64567 RepID=A0A9P5S1B7_9FUNG|nr:hypothetical protein BG015_005707 [Linnemannia schmuckeri]